MGGTLANEAGGGRCAKWEAREWSPCQHDRITDHVPRPLVWRVSLETDRPLLPRPGLPPSLRVSFSVSLLRSFSFSGESRPCRLCAAMQTCSFVHVLALCRVPCVKRSAIPHLFAAASQAPSVDRYRRSFIANPSPWSSHSPVFRSINPPWFDTLRHVFDFAPFWPVLRDSGPRPDSSQWRKQHCRELDPQHYGVAGFCSGQQLRARRYHFCC